MPILPFVPGRNNRSVALLSMASGTGRNRISVFLTGGVNFLGRALLVMSDWAQFFRLCCLTFATDTVPLSFRRTTGSIVSNPVFPVMRCADNSLVALFSATSGTSR